MLHRAAQGCVPAQLSETCLTVPIRRISSSDIGKKFIYPKEMKLALQKKGGFRPRTARDCQRKGWPLMKLLPGKVSKKRPPVLEKLRTDQNFEHDWVSGAHNKFPHLWQVMWYCTNKTESRTHSHRCKTWENAVPWIPGNFCLFLTQSTILGFPFSPAPDGRSWGELLPLWNGVVTFRIVPHTAWHKEPLE